MDRRVHEVLDRIASGIEALAEDPQVEINAGPPVCPSCNAFDPSVALAFQEGGIGPMSQIIIDGTCTNCTKRFFIVIESYSVHKTIETAGEEIKAREKAGFFDQ
jgi:hypothetical protein